MAGQASSSTQEGKEGGICPSAEKGVHSEKMNPFQVALAFRIGRYLVEETERRAKNAGRLYDCRTGMPVDASNKRGRPRGGNHLEKQISFRISLEDAKKLDSNLKAKKTTLSKYFRKLINTDFETHIKIVDMFDDAENKEWEEAELCAERAG